MYSIRDDKAQLFHVPFFNKTHGEAERNFKQLLVDDKSTISKYPEDFDLYYIGEYDDNTGKIETLATPQHIAKAINLKSQKDSTVL